MVEFKIKFDERIGKKLAEIQYQNTLIRIKKLKLIFIFLGLFLIAYPIVDLFSELFDYYILSIGVFDLIFWVLFPRVLRNNIYRQQDRIIKEGKLSEDITEEVYKFDSDKVFIFTTMGEKYRSAVETIYDYFVKVYEDDDCYVFYLSSVQCHIIFKDCLSGGSLVEFENYLRLNYKGERYIKDVKKEESI